MIAGLIRKEFRDLRPFLLLAVFLLLLDAGYWFMQQFDMQPLASSFPELGEEVAAAMFLIGFAVGTGLLIREIDDRTLGFLDGLPVTRLRVFVVKVAAAGAVLLLYPAGNLLLLAAQHAAARQSLDYAMHPALLWQSFAMICVLTGVGLSLGMLFGFLRNLCWLALALSAIVMRVTTLEWPGLAALNPLELLDVRLIGVHWQVPMSGLAAQVAMVIAFALLSMVIFLRSGGGQRRTLQLRLNRPLVSAAVTLATIGAVVAAIAVYVETSNESLDRTAVAETQIPGAQFAPSPDGNARTERYSFSYPAQKAGQAQALLHEADRIHTEVASILGVEPGARIDVDLSGSIENTEGTAFHDRIRMHLGSRPLDTLAHETAHVLAHRLAGGELERELTKMSVLNEGLADWIENTVSGKRGLTESGRLQAAIISSRHMVRPEQLTDIEALARNADRNLQYPLGAALVDSLVARYGRDAPRKLLLVLGQPDFPRDLYGTELWFAAFQAAGFDLALVFDDYARRLKSWESEFAVQIVRLPRPRGSLVVDAEYVGVELRFDTELPTGWSAAVRFRPQEDSSLDQYSTQNTDDDLVAWMNVTDVAAEQVCFQPGVSTHAVTIFEAWVCLPLESAAKWGG